MAGGMRRARDVQLKLRASFRADDVPSEASGLCETTEENALGHEEEEAWRVASVLGTIVFSILDSVLIHCSPQVLKDTEKLPPLDAKLLTSRPASRFMSLPQL